jgi:hypothetical protein
LLRFLWDWRQRKRLVNPSVANMAGMLQRTERTVQRHLRELEAAGDVLRVYNGGRGKQCVYYLGNAARAHAEKDPLWAPETRKGALRLGRRALSRKGDTRITLNGFHSLDHREGSEIIGGRAETGVASRPACDAAPPTPPMGGPGSAETTTAAPSSSSTAAPAPTPIAGPTSPPNPPRGGKTSGRKGSRAPAWIRHPALWRAVWGVWRLAYVRRFGTQPPPDRLDPVAMAGILDEAMLWAQQDENHALRYVAFGVLRFLRERFPAEGNRPGHVLWYLRRVRVSFGAPSATWTIPDLSASARAETAAPVHRPHVETPAWLAAFREKARGPR